jgi:hypothetical protein
MQINKYIGGGWCIHKITLNDSKGHFSVYLDEDKNLIDAEQIILWSSRQVKKGGYNWNRLENKIKNLAL